MIKITFAPPKLLQNIDSKYSVVSIEFSGDANTWVYGGEIFADGKALQPKYYTDPCPFKPVSFGSFQEAEDFIVKHGKQDRWFVKVGAKELPSDLTAEDFDV